MAKDNYDYNFKILSAFSRMYQKNIVNGNRFGSKMEKQIKHQISLVCADLRDNYKQFKKDYANFQLTHDEFESHLKKLKVAINEWPGLVDERTGFLAIIEEVKN